MKISPKIRIVPIPYIDKIDEDGVIHFKNPTKQGEVVYAINDLDLSESQLRKKGSCYYVQKLVVKIEHLPVSEELLHCLLMPCIIEFYDIAAKQIRWGGFDHPVRAKRKSIGIGSEFKMERTSISPFFPISFD